MTAGWHPASWRSRPAAQQPVYADAAALAAVEAELAAAQPIVDPRSVADLKSRLAEAAAARALLLQGGDCAETFAEPDFAGLAALFDRLAEGLETAALPVVRIARIAGQFAKPRTIEGEVWRGEIVNSREELRPDPGRMLRAHDHSRRTAGRLPGGLFTSHEALLLPYEEALVRTDPHGRSYGASGHFLWIGERTRDPDGAHVELLSGLVNPVGVKLGPATAPTELLRLADRLDPLREPGRLTLIVRHGASEIGRALPPLIRALRTEGRAPLWISDPMHGNTLRGGSRKVRRLLDMIAEAERFVAVARAEGVWPGGLHLEMTPEIVAECSGGREGQGWTSACDPRLNPDQAAALVGASAAALSRREAA
jgi:3-deoxy-7-phosphoheptulonate synthase